MAATSTKPRSRAKAAPVNYEPFQIEADRLLDLVADAGQVATPDDSRPLLTHIRLDLADNLLTASATDSYMLIETSMATDPAQTTGQTWTRYLSRSDRALLVTLLKATGKEAVTVSVSPDDPGVTVTGGSQSVTLGAVVENWPDFQKLWAMKRSQSDGTVGVNPDLLVRFSRLRAYKKARTRIHHGACKLEFGDHLQPIAWTITGTDCRGLLMPMRVS